MNQKIFNKRRLFLKFQLIPAIICLQIVHACTQMIMQIGTLHRLLCFINSHQQDLSLNDSCLIPLLWGKANDIHNSLAPSRVYNPWGNVLLEGELQSKKSIIKGPYADHILIPPGSTGSSVFFGFK